MVLKAFRGINSNFVGLFNNSMPLTSTMSHTPGDIMFIGFTVLSVCATVPGARNVSISSAVDCSFPHMHVI